MDQSTCDSLGWLDHQIYQRDLLLFQQENRLRTIEKKPRLRNFEKFREDILNFQPPAEPRKP